MNTFKTADAEVVPTSIQLSELGQHGTLGARLLSANFDLVRNVKVNVSVVAGQSTLPVGELMALRAGQVMTLESPLDAPMDIVLEGRVVARGELVAVGEHFGVRIVAAPQGAAA